MKNLATLIAEKKCRKGESNGTTKKGAYWLAIAPVTLRDFGGDGIGNAAANQKVKLYLRHFRSGEVAAVLAWSSWHQNGGRPTVWQACPELLDCETIEDIIVVLKATKIWEQDTDCEINAFSDHCIDNLDCLSELGLPVAAPSPDETDPSEPTYVGSL
jgi:hypothetical protein